MMDSVTVEPAEPGWYEDPEAPDLERWWQGEHWSDTEFRAKPEDHHIVQYMKGYAELSPRSPTNFIATSSLVCAIIELVAAAALVVTSSKVAASAAPSLATATLLLLVTATILGLGLWTAVMSGLSVANGRRTGRRLPQAVAALGCAVVSAGLSLLAFARLLPDWLLAPGS